MTLGDCGIYMIKGVGDVLVGRVERSRLVWEKAAGMRLQFLLSLLEREQCRQCISGSHCALRCGTCPECPHVIIIIISLFCSSVFTLF